MIPNAGDAAYPAQAEPDSKDLEIITAGFSGSGVVSGCTVAAQGSPNMTVAVASGTVVVAGVQAAVSSGNVTITTADGTNPRIDLIVANNAGTKSATAGTPAGNPVFPAIPANSVVLAAVFVPPGDTAINSNQITDKRVLIVVPTSGIPGPETGLKIIRGIINTTGAGSIVEGTGFTITRNGTGDVTVNFTAAFSDVPVFVTNIVGTSSESFPVITATGSAVRTTNQFGADRTFHFFAIGPA